MAKPLRVLVTGSPGVGKTTLCTKVAEVLPESAKMGFLCHERRNERGTREAFDLVSLDGASEAPLADEKGPDKGAKVSKYFVQVDELERFSFPILDQALSSRRTAPLAFIFDEIGKMEMKSKGFVDRVRRLLTSPDPNLHVLGTVALKGEGFIAESKRLSGVDVVEVNEGDRDAKAKEVADRFLAALQGGSGVQEASAQPAGGDGAKSRRWALAGQGASSAGAGAAADSPAAASAPAAGDSERVRFDLPAPGEFSAVYLEKPDANFASVNAGSYNLFVGGSAINRAFREALQACGQNPREKYEVIHEALLRKAARAPGKLQWVSPGDVDDWALEDAVAVCGLVPEGERMAALRPVGLVSVVVFPPGRRPRRNDRNVAMVYVVGPNAGNTKKKGRRDVDRLSKNGFLEVIENVGGAVSSAVCQYNQAAASEPSGDAPQPASDAVVRRVDPEDGQALSFEECQKRYQRRYRPNEIKHYWQHECRPDPSASRAPGGPLPKIDILRVCLLSGGVYKHPDATKVEVASSLIKGLTASRPQSELPTLDFAFDEDCFRIAWRALGASGGAATAGS